MLYSHSTSPLKSFLGESRTWRLPDTRRFPRHAQARPALERNWCGNTKDDAAWNPTLIYLSQQLPVLVFSALHQRKGEEISRVLWKYRRGLVSAPTFKMLGSHHSCLYNNSKKMNKLKINFLNLSEKWGHRENCHSKIECWKWINEGKTK